MSIGSKVLFLYFMLTYGLQSFFSVIFTYLYNGDYRGYTEGLSWKLLLMLTIGMAILFGQAAIKERKSLNEYDKPVRKSLFVVINVVRIVSAITFIGLSIPFAFEYGFSFFHSGLYISDLPLWVIVLQAMKPFARLDLGYCTIKVMRGEKLSNTDILATASYTVGGIISLSGAIDVVFLVLGFLLLIKRGQIVMRAFTLPKNGQKSKKKWMAYLFLAASLPGVAVIGFANKIGFERTYDLLSDENTAREYFIYPLVLRVSSSHGSFVANAELPLSVDEQAEIVSYPFNNMLWRGCILFSDSCPNRGDITHIARLNYIRTFWDQSPLKAGATPGLLASALYIPFLPFAVLLLSFYCSLFTAAMDRALARRKVPFAGVLTLLLFAFPVFENPIDLIVIFDPAVVYTLGLLFVLRSFRNYRPVDVRQGFAPKASPSAAMSGRRLNGNRQVAPNVGI